MEIVTIMLAGELTHEDTMGNKAVMRAGEVQYMSAGTGVRHSEVNNGKESTHLYQIWLMPKQNGLAPSYKQKDFTSILNENKNTLVPVISDVPHGEVILIQSDASIYKAVLDKGKSLTNKILKGRGVLIYITEGELNINSTTFAKGDQARISSEESINILAIENSEFVLVDVLL
jgi:redox-sensitive bicupin YhaK (pirin superfamily)